MAQLRAGDERAFEVLFNRYRGRLLGFCRRILRSNEDAEDVLQEVFVAAHEAILADERRIEVRAWLYRITRNRCLNHLRGARAEARDSLDDHPHQGGITTEERAAGRQELRDLVANIRGLPESQRSALLLRELEALSYEQIAAAMETTVPAVKSLLVRARLRLRAASRGVAALIPIGSAKRLLGAKLGGAGGAGAAGGGAVAAGGAVLGSNAATGLAVVALLGAGGTGTLAATGVPSPAAVVSASTEAPAPPAQHQPQVDQAPGPIAQPDDPPAAGSGRAVPVADAPGETEDEPVADAETDGGEPPPTGGEAGGGDRAANRRTRLLARFGGDRQAARRWLLQARSQRGTTATEPGDGAGRPPARPSPTAARPRRVGGPRAATTTPPARPPPTRARPERDAPSPPAARRGPERSGAAENE